MAPRSPRCGGELAWQPGGHTAHDIVPEADRTRTNPVSALTALIQSYAPCLILVDEWVAYARQLYGRDDLPGGSFATQFTFAQTLTEVVAAPGGCWSSPSPPPTIPIWRRRSETPTRAANRGPVDPVNPSRYARDLTKLSEEILQHLTSVDGAQVEIRVDISARRADGFGEDTVRIVGENATTLKFDDSGFVDE